MSKRLLLILVVALVFAATAKAQTVTATLTAGGSPFSVAVNPVTNKIYVTNSGSNNVTVIDGATNANATTTVVAVGLDPEGVAVNTVTNQIYVANEVGDTVTVIDGATNATTTVAVGTGPRGIAVNTVTNKIYVANVGSNNVTVIDGATNTTTTVAAGTQPVPVAVDPVTNKIYVANEGGTTVTVIDGATNATTTVTVGTAPFGVAVNPVTNQIYVANNSSNNVTVIDGVTNNITTVTAGTEPIAVAVDPVTNKIYVANNSSNNVTVIDGATNTTTTLAAVLHPEGVGVNPVTNEIFVINSGGTSLTVIDGATNTTTTLAVGTNPVGVAVNPVTNKIYLANSGSNNVTVIDGATNTTATVATGFVPSSETAFVAAVNPVTNKAYVANQNANGVTVIDGDTNATTTVTDPNAIDPFVVAVNTATNKTYVANSGSNNVTVIDGATNATTTVTDPNAIDPFAVAVNPVTNKIYVANFTSGNVTVIDGTTNNVTSVVAGSQPSAVAVNPITNKIYVANNSDNNVTVIDGATNTTTTVTDPNAAGAFAVAVNPVTNKIYVANSNDGGTTGNVTVIDGATNNTTTVAVETDPFAVAVNTVTDEIYVTNGQGTGVTVIDGATNATTTVTDPNAAFGPTAVAVNPVTNKIYVANFEGGASGNVTVIDGATNATTTVTDGNAVSPMAVAVNPVTNQIYVANQNSGNVTVITEQQVQPIPLTTTITPLVGNQTANPTPTFTFSASTSFAPTAPPVDALYFQFDTWQGPWTAATSTGGGGFTGTAPTLSLGTHILYAYATDGQDATSTMTTIDGGSSPLIGAISAYLFNVVNQASAPVVSFSANPAAFGNQNVNITSSTLQITLSNQGNANLSLTNVSALGGNNPGDFAVLNTTTCTTGATVVVSGSCVLNLTFTPSATGARSATIIFTDNAADSPETLTLTGTGTTASGSLTISPSTLPNGAIGSAYGQTLRVTGGTPPFTFSITSGSLPAGLTLGASNGTIAGVPTGPAGPSTFTVGVTDSSSPTPLTGSATFTITINAADTSNNAELNGHYAFLFSGFTGVNGALDVFAGSFTANGNGTINNGVVDSNSSAGLTFGGTYSIGADNRGTMSLTISGAGSATFALAVGDIQAGVATKARFIRFDGPGEFGNTGSGIILQQDPTAFTLGSIKGNYAFGESGELTTNGNPESGVGFVTADGNGNFTTGLIDTDTGGTLLSSAALSGTYATTNSSASNGRFTASVTEAGVSGTFVDNIYVISASQVVYISVNTTADSVLSGSAQLQVPPAGGFGVGSLSGNSVFSVQGLQSGASSSVHIGDISADGDGDFTASFDSNESGTSSTGTASGTYTVASNGRSVLTFTTVSGGGSIQPAIVYLDGVNQGFVGFTDGSADGGIIEPGGSGFTNASLNGNYFLGTSGPTENQVHDLSGVGSFDGISAFNATTDESDPGGVLSADNLLSTTYSVASNGRFTFTSQGGTLVGYIASGCKAEIISDNSANPGIIPLECQVTPVTTPQVSLSATSLTFPATDVADTSSVQTVTVTNTGNANLNFSALTPTGDFAVVVAGSANPACAIATPLTPTSKCDISVVFTPTAAGTRTGTLSIADNAANSPQTVSLTGTGIAVGANITITPSATVNFGNQLINTTSGAITTTVTNAGNQSITLTSVTLNPAPNGPAGTNPDGFAIVPGQGNCVAETTLAASGGFCVLPVTFGPTAPGAVSSTITINDSLGNQVITLNGTGTAPTITLNPTSLTLSAAPDTTSAAQTVTVTNSGAAPLHIANVTLGGTDAADFAFVNGTTPCAKGVTVQPQAACTVGVDFTAPSQATFNATVTITSDASNGTQTIPLTGTGVVISITPPPGGTTTATTNPGGTAVFPLILSSTGLTGNATLTCTSPSTPTITCNVVPSTVALTPNGVTHAAIVVNTFCQGTTPSSTSVPGIPTQNLSPAPWLMAIVGLTLLASMALTKKRSLRLVMPLAALLLAGIFASSCGSPPKGPNGVTPPGVYKLMITATVGEASSSITLTLTVN
jgi:YVTN family beta-propeller protein